MSSASSLPSQNAALDFAGHSKTDSYSIGSFSIWRGSHRPSSSAPETDNVMVDGAYHYLTQKPTLNEESFFLSPFHYALEAVKQNCFPGSFLPNC